MIKNIDEIVKLLFNNNIPKEVITYYNDIEYLINKYYNEIFYVLELEGRIKPYDIDRSNGRKIIFGKEKIDFTTKDYNFNITIYNDSINISITKIDKYNVNIERYSIYNNFLEKKEYSYDKKELIIDTKRILKNNTPKDLFNNSKIVKSLLSTKIKELKEIDYNYYDDDKLYINDLKTETTDYIVVEKDNSINRLESFDKIIEISKQENNIKKLKK